MKFRVLARHKWVVGATITESVWRLESVEDALAGVSTRRFTATILGYRNWRIYQGPVSPNTIQYVIDTVREIRDRLEAGDEAVLSEPNEYATEEKAK